MQQPLQIYLDSSDYSNLSKPDAYLSTELKNLKNQLLTLTKNGAVEIRFSAAHISEIAHLEFRHKTQATQRATLISDLCLGKAMKWPQELFALEAASAFHRKTLPPFPLYGQSNSGHWFPHIQVDIGNNEKLFREEIKIALKKKGLPRDQRRKIERSFMVDGHLRAELIPLVKQFQQVATSQFEAMFPLTESFYQDEMVLKWATGQISNDLFEKELFKGITDPKNFIGWYFDRYSDAKSSIFWLRDLSKKISTIANIFIDKADGIRESSTISPSMLEKTLRDSLEEQKINMKRRLMPELIRMSPELLAPLQISPNKLSKQVADAEYAAPGFDLFLALLIEHVSTSMTPHESRRHLKDSDFVDFIHAAYLPYMDLFRCDGYCANLIQAVNPDLAKRVVPKLVHLEEALTGALQN